MAKSLEQRLKELKAMGATVSVVDPNAQSDADKCRANGWTVGTRLVGDEGRGPTVIELTAIGQRSIMAKTISHNGVPSDNDYESSWTLSCRDWKKVGGERN